MTIKRIDEADRIQKLVDAIDAGDDEAAERAAQMCAGEIALLPALRPLLADADNDRRWWAVRTLALIGGPEAAALLLRPLTDPDEATRCAAALALGQARAVDAISALGARLADDSGWVRDSAADALAMIGDAALPALVQALTDERDGVRVRAASALRKAIVPALKGLKTPEYGAQYWTPISALFQALNDPNRLVRHNAYEALDRLRLLEMVVIPG
jgi:HEAT repeat protein